MTSRTKRVMVQAVGALVAAGLLYLALRNVDLSGLWEALATANYWWLIPLVLVTLLSHALRAWRWRMLLDALPKEEATGSGERVTFKTAFYSVMVGYLFNIVAPRLGEVARSANLAAQAGWRFSSVFGTVVVERLLDMVSLLLILVPVGLLLVGSPAAEAMVFRPLREQISSLSGIDGLLIATALIVVVGCLFVLSRFLRSEGKNRGMMGRLLPIIRSFRSGFVTLFRSPHRVGIFATTVGIWIGYWILLYIPLHMLRMAEPYDLGLTAAVVLLGIGSVGFILPTPAGVGGYHYFVIETLVQLFDVAYETAAGFAVLTHAAQVVIITITGFACIVAQGSSFGSLLKSARDVQEGPPDEAPPSETDHSIS